MATTLAPPERKSASRDSHIRLGIWIALAPIVMTFASLSSAYIFRQGFASDWRTIQMPRLVWLNTAILLLSSIALEIGKSALKRDRLASFKGWAIATTILGAAFLAGQLVVWRDLVHAGVYISTSPNSSFFYLMTGAHGLHLFGGVIALFYVVSGALRSRYSSERRTAVDVTAIYWHFMDGLWVYVLLLLTLWR